jgi:hypothetical protein
LGEVFEKQLGMERGADIYDPIADTGDWVFERRYS